MFLRSPDVGDEELGDEYPLSDERVASLRHRRTAFEKHLICEYGMIAELVKFGCINERQEEALESTRRDSERISLLVDMLIKSSVAAYKKFLRCLDETHQSDLVSLLSGEGGI